MKRAFLVSAVVAMLFAGSAAAPAAGAPVPEVEPNDNLWNAGSLDARGVTGAISSAGDIDLFRFQVLEFVEVHHTFANLGGGGRCSYSVGTLWDERAWDSGSVGPGDAPLKNYWHSQDTVDRGMLLRVEGEAGCAYSFTIDAGWTNGPATKPAPKVAVPERNDSRATAWGPLKSGVTYTGVIGHSGDSEWVYFWANSQISDVLLTSPVPGCQIGATFYEYVDGRSRHVRTITAVGPAINVFYPAAYLRKHPFMVEITGKEGCPWGLETPREGLRATCRVGSGAVCKVTAWISRAAARRLRIPLGRGKMVRIASGRVRLLKSGSAFVDIPIRRQSVLRALIAARGPIVTTLQATAGPIGGGIPATATARIKIGT